MPFTISALPENASILLIRLRSIGDVTLNTAMFPVIKENLPRCRLDYLVNEPIDELVRHNPFLDRVLTLSRRGGVIDVFQQLLALRQAPYDLVIDMHGGPTSALLTRLSGARRRAGLARSRRSWLYNVLVDPVFGRPALAVEFQRRMLELLGFRVNAYAPKIYLTAEESGLTRQKLAAAGVLPGKEYAVIHPGVDAAHNEWEAEKFAIVADALQDRYHLAPVFACGPGQARQVERITRRTRSPAYALPGQPGLREFAALCQGARLLLCHNSGPMHIGAAVGTPVFALFGASAPDRWLPQVAPSQVFYKKIECSPCTHASRRPECDLGNPECKRLITPDEVLAAIEGKLALNRAGGGPPP